MAMRIALIHAEDNVEKMKAEQAVLVGLHENMEE
jgi:hypothetical protein